MTSADATAAGILHFWFTDTAPAQWWRADAGFDALITQRYGALHQAAAAGELAAWRATPQGRLAEVIVLDQFSRNIHRGTPRAFAHDGMALVLAQHALAAAADAVLAPVQRAFLYLPFMHSESRAMQAESERLYRALGLAGNLDAALRHRAIVDRFGRYPHRNAALGRESSADELAFLQQPGSSF
ncbi:DUF924 family protein [Aquabacterium sp. OR-4]|uniref:DUF924 family protein n=1 Tax=Aquabacterium sp. OR-4 TaxID=2978127 RepID=UPI0021B28915|nr:DUF924 family protein [Aquabacterium sp. OR-4]MDT7833842.1 DUF924 family protein [Aquabacterium sp. OR-4]